jgi:hypothetical protein
MLPLCDATDKQRLLAIPLFDHEQRLNVDVTRETDPTFTGLLKSSANRIDYFDHHLCIQYRIPIIKYVCFVDIRP